MKDRDHTSHNLYTLFFVFKEKGLIFTWIASQTHYVAVDGLELVILLSLPLGVLGF